MIPMGGRGALWHGVWDCCYIGDNWTAIGRSDRQFYYCSQTENIQHFK
jgi:hypothetical protein